VAEFRRRAEVRRLVGGGGSLSFSHGGRQPRFALASADAQRLERLRVLVDPGHLGPTHTGSSSSSWIIQGRALERLLAAYAHRPAPPRWRHLLPVVHRALAVLAEPRHPAVAEPIVPELVSGPFRSTMALRQPVDAGWSLNPDPRWGLEFQLQWLAGLVDGDGSLAVPERGSVQLQVFTGEGERPVLETVRSLLGGRGFIYSYPHRGSGVSYVLGSAPHLRQLLPLLAPYLRHPAKRRRLVQAHQRLGLAPPAPAVGLAVNGGWVAGAIQSDAGHHVHE
jgi:hypothetical protein